MPGWGNDWGSNWGNTLPPISVKVRTQSPVGEVSVSTMWDEKEGYVASRLHPGNDFYAKE